MKRLLTGLLVLLPLAAEGAWVDATGKAIPDTESMRSAGDLGVQIVLTADEAQFRRTWNTSATPPRLKTTDTVRVGGTVSALLIFHGCAPNAAGACDVVSEFVLQAPDGSRTPGGGGPVWSGKPVQQGQLQLGQADITIAFDRTDPPGDYSITANIKDRVSGKGLSVVARLKLAP